jgi:hypothetical protein
MTKYLFISDLYRHQNPDLPLQVTPDQAVMVAPAARGVPGPEALAAAEMVVVLGPLESQSHAEELGRGLAVAVGQHSTVAVVAYGATLTPPDRAMLSQLTTASPSFGAAPKRVTADVSSFTRYFALYGKSVIGLELPPDAVVLGRMPGGEPAAFMQTLGRGALYVAPYSVASAMQSHSSMLTALIAAVHAHQGGGAEPLPEFLGELRLPGEEATLAELEGLESRVSELQENAHRLERYRQLAGRLSGDPFEELVIDALNRVLEPTAYRAEDRPDLSAEDFWLVGPDGDHAVAEAKGIGSNVRRQDVSQVEMHRAQIQDDRDEDLHGLLVVNTFRSADDLARKQLPVNDDIAHHAERLNVLVLRGWDLFQLLDRALSGQGAGEEFLGALSDGGGWLEVTADGLTRHRGG